MINLNSVLFMKSLYEWTRRSTVRVVASKSSGMGKSLYVKRLAQKLQKQCQMSQHVIVPVHGPVVNADTVMASLCNHITGQTPIAQIIHFDIASSVSSLARYIHSFVLDILHVVFYTV